MGTFPRHKAASYLPHSAPREAPQPIILSGDCLTIRDLMGIARVQLSRDDNVLRRLAASCDFVTDAVREHRPVYGITSALGGMSQIDIPAEEAELLQQRAVWAHKTGIGNELPSDCVRASMALRINSHMRGASGVTLELIERIVALLNSDVTPVVPELGPIGASGDLVPLAYITGAVVGLDDGFVVEFRGERMSACAALERLHLQRYSLRPKEALAMMNGTAFSTAIAASCVHDSSEVFAATLGVHALAIQALHGGAQSFEPFIHDHKPHPGQRWVAGVMRRLLGGSQMTRPENGGVYDGRAGGLIQDRYSLRCLPQFLGPVADGIAQVRRQVEVEMNAATDNPLIDGETRVSYHGGNFLAEYVGIAMDHLRYYLGLSSKHVDVQIALLMSPEFSNGLPPSLVGNTAQPSNMGLKGLQLTGNSIMPLISFYGMPFVDRFPTHAEQFNQNINSQSFGTANLARRSVSLSRQHVALSLLAAVQAVDLRAGLMSGCYDARKLLSPLTAPLYEVVRTLVERPPDPARPYVWNDDQQTLDSDIDAVTGDLARGGRIAAVLEDLLPAGGLAA